MTIAESDLSFCTMELDKAKVLDAVKELVLARTVSTRDVANKLAAGSDTDATAIEYEVQE